MNFRAYEKISELKNDEDDDLFPPRFVIEVVRNYGYHTLHAECKISCYDKDTKQIFDYVVFTINIVGSYTIKGKLIIKYTST